MGEVDAGSALAVRAQPQPKLTCKGHHADACRGCDVRPTCSLPQLLRLGVLTTRLLLQHVGPKLRELVMIMRERRGGGGGGEGGDGGALQQWQALGARGERGVEQAVADGVHTIFARA